MFGLAPDTLRNIKLTLKKQAEISKVIIYGSRAKGNYRDGSDIDITLIGKKLNMKTIYKLEEELEELYLPYTFDISIFSQIDNNDLIKHILSVGKTFYLKDMGELPKGWEIKKLGEVSTVSAGNSAPQKKEYFIDGYVASHLATIKSSIETNNKYLLYFLITIDARNLMQDISYPSLKLSDIKLINIPIPPLSEQKRIVSVLDEAFEAIAKAKKSYEQNLKNAKELFESYLNGVFEERGDGVGIKSLNQKSLSMLSIPLPPIEEQKEIVKKLDKLQIETKKLEIIYQKKLDSLEELKKALLEKAFSGEL